jgi:hypothetical protein
MKNINHKNNSRINSVGSYIAISLIVFFIAACTANHNISQSATSAGKVEQSGNHTTVSLKEFEQYRDRQLKWLSGLQDGMSTEDALKQVTSYLKYFFQYIEGDVVFQYMEGHYPITQMQFGLLFEDGKLTNLILNKTVNDFFWHRYNYGREWGHLFQYWLPNGLQEGVTMVRKHNRLGDDYNDVSNTYPQEAADTGGASKAAEAAITTLFFAPFAPAVLMVMPFMPEDNNGDETFKEITETANDKLGETSRKIELGITTDKELIAMLGTPAYKDNETLSFQSPYIRVGINNGVVIWSESWFDIR